MALGLGRLQLEELCDQLCSVMVKVLIPYLCFISVVKALENLFSPLSLRRILSVNADARLTHLRASHLRTQALPPHPAFL